MERGWPFFEQAVSGMITDCNNLIELDFDEVNDAELWVDLHEHCRAHRKPPLSLEAFRLALQTKVFTNGLTQPPLEICVRRAMGSYLTSPHRSVHNSFTFYVMIHPM